MRKGLGAVLFAAGFALGGTAHAGEIFSFGCLTLNKAADCNTGVNQLSMEVKGGLLPGTVEFIFRNTGPNASSVADIYFDWLDPADKFPFGLIVNGSGVNFSWGAAPPNLPGGAPIGFTADLAADSNNPTQPNGINPGEWLRFGFIGDLASTIADLYAGDLRIGLHVQGFRGGGSESFVSNSFVTPEPGTLAIVGFSLVALAGLTRRRR
jgi:hypothetical protein